MVKRGEAYLGLLQAFADALKLLLKEYVAPTQANIVLFFLGPVITLIFALLGYAVIPYGPGLTVNDFSLGIYYMLAVSSLATYGILLAGCQREWLLTFIHVSISYSPFFCLILNLILISNIYILFSYEIFLLLIVLLDIIYIYLIRELYNNNSKKVLFNQGYPFVINKVKLKTLIKNTQKRFIHTTKHLNNINKPNLDESIKSLHSIYIKELYKDRAAPVIPFNRELIKSTCTNFQDKKTRITFLKEWGSKSGIYIIEYKYDPLIYYIGRTTLFKRRFNNHLKCDSGNKLHIFMNLVGWEHFNISVVEECALDTLGLRENYYIQEYLPLLNSAYLSSISEKSINHTLKSKLDLLKKSNSTVEFKKNISLFVYDLEEDGIKNSAVHFNSIKEASIALDINHTSLSQYRDTSVPYRGKLIYTSPIEDFDMEYEAVLKNTPQNQLNKVTPIKVWAYEAKTLKLIEGSPFESKNKASSALGISRTVIDYFLDKDKPEGVIGNYLYTRSLDNHEIENLLEKAENLQLGNKKGVWAYEANTLELINNSPFPSIQEAANYFQINYRTISRHLDTNLATVQNNTFVYFFKKEIDSNLKDTLIQNKPVIASYTRSEIWVYKINADEKLTLIPNQPFKTKREAIKTLRIHIKDLNKYLDTGIAYKDLMFFTSSQDNF